VEGSCSAAAVSSRLSIAAGQISFTPDARAIPSSNDAGSAYSRLGAVVSVHSLAQNRPSLFGSLLHPQAREERGAAAVCRWRLYLRRQDDDDRLVTRTREENTERVRREKTSEKAVIRTVVQV